LAPVFFGAAGVGATCSELWGALATGSLAGKGDFSTSILRMEEKPSNVVELLTEENDLTQGEVGFHEK
jgi:hypothetical protein